MLISINNGVKSFGSQDVFTKLNFVINGKEKIALVGRNGSGKTTLMRLLTQQEPLDKGELAKQSGIKLGYLEQVSFEDESKSVLYELQQATRDIRELQVELRELAATLDNDSDEKQLNRYANLQQRFEMLGGYEIEHEMNSLMTSFGFSLNDLNRELQSFSGGEKTRLAFIKMLLSKPDVLLLDEPTNHLDIMTIEWLEGYLKKYPAAIVLTSHDRLFLDRVCDTVVEVENGTLTRYKGNYTSYIEQKKKFLEKQEKLYQYQQKDVERLEKLIDKFRHNKNKAAFAKSKQKYLDRMEKIDDPGSAEQAMNLHFSSAVRGGKDVLTMENCKIGYEEPLLKVNLELKRGNRLAIIGENGSGKSTLIKTIMGLVPLLSGEMLWGHQIEVGYFDQNLHQFEGTHTVLEELWDSYPQLNRTQVRTVLGSFLFKGDDVFKSVAILSGGEKVRLQLAKLMLKRANLLILDEPTNHLDIESKQALEDALLNYDGTILFVSHDRYFISKIANGIARIENKELVVELHNLQEALQQNQTVDKTEKKKENQIRRNISSELRTIERKLKKVLESLETKTEEIESLRDLRYEPEYYHDYEKMSELNEEIDRVNNEMAHLEQEWEALEIDKEELYKEQNNTT